MYKTVKQRSWVGGLLLLLMGVLSGCGYHLRGSLDQPLYIPAAMKVTFIASTTPNGELSRRLRTNLVRYGVEVTTNRAEATGILQIIDERFRRRVLSVDGGAKEQEFELFLQVTFKLSSQDGLEIIETQTLSIDRNYLFDKNDPLGKDKEESVIRQEMVRNLVVRMLRVIRAKTAATSGASEVETPTL